MLASLTRYVAARELGLFALTALVCWMGGWRTWYDYTSGLIHASVGLICLGAASLKTTWGPARSPKVRYGQTARSEKMYEAIRQAQREASSSASFMLRVGALGIAPSIVGVAVQTLALTRLGTALA